MDANPDVCLQVEEISDPEHWRSAIVTGRVERLKEQQDIDQAMQSSKHKIQCCHLRLIAPGLMLEDVPQPSKSIAFIPLK